MNNLAINKEEWKAEIDKYRNTEGRNIEWTDEMDEMILYARSGNAKVSFQKLETIFKKKFNIPISRSAIRNRYDYLIEKEENC